MKMVRNFIRGAFLTCAVAGVVILTGCRDKTDEEFRKDREKAKEKIRNKHPSDRRPIPLSPDKPYVKPDDKDGVRTPSLS